MRTKKSEKNLQPLNLSEALNTRASIVEKIIENDGEITSDIEARMTALEKEVTEKTDAVATARYNLKTQIETYKVGFRQYIETLEKKLERLDGYIKPILGFHGDQKTPFSSLKLVSRNYDKVFVEDFNQVMAMYPDAVTVFTDNNIRTITLSKKVLLEKWNESNGQVSGFSVRTEATTWVESRLKLLPRNNDGQDGPGENEDEHRRFPKRTSKHTARDQHEITD